MSEPRAGDQAQPPTHSPHRAGARVAMFINSFRRGGGETQFLRIAHALRRDGYDVKIFVLLEGNDFGNQLDDLSVTLLSPRPGLQSLVNAVRSIRDYRPDVVLSFLYQGAIVGRIAARLCGVGVVITSMRSERLENPARTALYRLTGVVDTATVTNSMRAVEILEANRTVRRGWLRYIPNGVDLRLFDRPARLTLRQELGLSDDVFLYLGIGRLAPQKDWPTLIAAIAAYDGPAAHWAIAGRGAQESALLAQIDACALSSRITLLGLRDDAPDLLAACDALVLSSTYEGLPNVVLEAMAAGRPVVATRVGGCAELIGSECGILVEPSQPQQLAAAMAQLARREPAERTAMGMEGRQRVRRNYSLDATNEQWIRLVDELLERTASHRR